MATIPPSENRTIARAIRSSRLMDATLKKHWLAVLPHLAAEDRARLWSILTENDRHLDPKKGESG